MKKVMLVLAVALLAAVGLVGCASTAEPRMGKIENKRVEQSSAGEEMLGSFAVDQKMVDAGSQVSIQGSGKVEKGWIRMVVYGPDGKQAWMNGDFGGEYNFNGYYKPPQVGTYKLAVGWRDATAGTFSLAYQALLIGPLVMLPGIGMLLVGIGFIVYSLRRGGTWAYLGLGALAWIVTVAVKFAIAVPLNPMIVKALHDPNNLFAPSNLVLYVYIGGLTGLTEVLLTWGLLRKSRFGRAPWRKALAFGVGFGAVEAILVGISPLVSGVMALVAPQTLPAEAIGNVMLMANPLYGLAPIAERFATILVHIVCNVLLFYAVATRQVRWMWVSFIFKSLLDTVAAFAQFWGVGTIERIWTIEAVIIVFGAVAWWGIRAVQQRYPEAEAEIAQAVPALETM